MAKKKQQHNTDPKAQTLARIKRTEAYAEQVRKLFAATVNEILALNRTMPTLNEGEMFSFAGESLKKQKEVERLLRQLHAVATMAIQKGIRLEWAQANAECDRLVQSCFGKRALNTPQFSAWTQRNEAAMAAFIARSERGLNLSERVWKSCRQLRDEMEVAITVAVGDGTSAATMSRRVRQYLNDPDLMFRRFRYRMTDKDGNPKVDEHGKPVYGLKWKKKITKEDGSVGWIDYDKDSYHDQWTGPGYYKSSAQNAMRVARTETNIAYRRADNERWKQMDFVLGQRVQLSRSHPKKDICDKLAGDYPPDFVFDGWHPQCFCFVTPILVDEDEIVKMNEAMMNGEEYRPRGKRITDYPDGFKEWVRENEDKLLDAHKAGTDPYFVRNNFADVQNILNPKKQLTPLEIAEQRHAARTPEQEEAIRLRWQERQAQREAERLAEEQERKRIAQINTTANNVLGVAKSRFADFGIDTSALDIAMQSGDTNLIKAETRALAKILSEKQQQIKQKAKSVVDTASKYKDFEGSTDVLALYMAAQKGNLSAIHTQTQAVEAQVNSLKAKLNALSHLPNVHQWGEEFTVHELELANKAVDDMIKKNSGGSLQSLRDKLAYEADWVKNHPKYSTSKVVQQAYEEKVKELEEQIKWEDIKKQHAAFVLKFASTFPNLTKELTDAINAKDFAAAQAAVITLQKWDNVITQRTQMAAALGASNAGMLKDVDDAIAIKNVSEAENALKKLSAWQDILKKRADLATNIGATHSALFVDLDTAIKDNKPIVAKKAVDVLERWAKVIAELDKAKAIKQTKELTKLIKELEGHITAKKIDDAEVTVGEIQKLTMSALEQYCQKHYTEKFTVKSQKTYDDVMTNMGKVSQPVWQAATQEEKQAFVDYCGSHSYDILTDIAAGRHNVRAERIDKVMAQIKYPHDIVLRSGQDFCMAEYVFNADFRSLLETGQIDELNKKYAGLIGTNVAYMSTSFNEKGGFTKDFEFHLFCPKGTSMMNVYVLSPFGNGEGTKWDGASYPKTWSDRGETEIFLGRNLLYKFIRAEAGTGKGGTTRIYVQVIGTA